MRYSTLFIFLVFSVSIRAQSSQISGRVTDLVTGKGIPFTSLGWLSLAGGSVADEEGYFTLDAVQLPQRLIVSSLGYQPDTLLLTRASYLEIKLTATGAQLPEVNVTAEQEWEVINKEKVFPIDFTVCDNLLYVLGQRGVGNNYHLSVYSAAGEMQFERELTIGKVIGLESNCFNQLMLKTHDFAIRLDTDQLEPVEKTPVQDYEKLFADCQASTPNHIYLEKVALAGFRKWYLVGERGGSDVDLFQAVWYREMARRTAAFLQRPVPRIIIDAASEAAGVDSGHKAVFDYDFDKEVTYKNHNENCLFLEGNHVVLFNFDHDAIEHFSLEGDSLATVEIGFNDEKNPDGAPMVHDPITGKYYAIRRAKGGYALSEVDLSTGGIVREYPLNIARYNKLVVLDDQVYMVGVALKGRASEYPRFMRRSI